MLSEKQAQALSFQKEKSAAAFKWRVEATQKCISIFSYFL
jgi:hypothetical protein